VCIYRGVLATSRDAGVRAFARRHLATERQHLALIDPWLAPGARSRLLPLWRVAGWLTGVLPALAGPRAVYATIAAVETFVDRHYQAQLDRLAVEPVNDALAALLERCRRDEAAHRDEAAAEAGRAGPGLRAWCALVGAGSVAAVAVSRHV
jgi:ubiquinone biosynthesis monooxygenase Coq7